MPATTRTEAAVLRDAAYAKALSESAYGFDDNDMKSFAEGEAEHGPIQNWSRTVFDTVIGALKGRAAFEVVREVKGGVVDDESRSAVLPEKAPYLEYGRDGKPKDYDPRDGSQFYEDPDTHDLFRWDGQNRVHPVVSVGHQKIGDVLLPRENEAALALASGKHWFHRGYKVWVGQGGKLLAEVDQESRDKVRVALAQRERARENDGSVPFRATPALA